MQEEWVSPTFRRLTVGEDHVSYAYVQIGYESVPEGEFGPEGLTQRWGGLDVDCWPFSLWDITRAVGWLSCCYLF